jgi:NADP-dependent 3-hydroxy acid dehydrogenase YdfG
MITRHGRVEGKAAIVTGAGSTPGPGMATGRACAIVLAREGARVLLADRNRGQAEETKRLIERDGGTAEVFVGDMTKAADCDAMVSGRPSTPSARSTSSSTTSASPSPAASSTPARPTGTGCSTSA